MPLSLFFLVTSRGRITKVQTHHDRGNMPMWCVCTYFFAGSQKYLLILYNIWKNKNIHKLHFLLWGRNADGTRNSKRHCVISKNATYS